ncbi:MAG: acyltransferase family protein [Archangium sp.]
MQPPPSTPPQRYAGLDAIRAGAMLLGLAYHATYSWLPRVGPWYFVADQSPVDALVSVTGALHSFRMQLFFALSGFFSHLVFERRGERAYFIDRSRRLLVPLVVALPIAMLLYWQLRVWSHSLGLMSSDFKPGTDFHALPLHLWFLIYLWSFCALALLAPKTTAFASLLTRALKFPPLIFLVLSALTGLGLWLHPENRPDGAFWPQPFELFHYGLFFAFGWTLWTVRLDAATPLRRWAWPFLLLGIGTMIFVYRGSVQWEPLGHALGGPIAWSITLGALGLALSSSTREENPALRFIVESSYWVYLIHYPVVLALQVVFAQQSLPGALEYSLATLGTLLVAWVTFVVFVWRTPLGPWLGVKPPVTVKK